MRLAFLAFVLVFLALPRIAAAQPLNDTQPVEVACGQDIVAWQSLEHRRLGGDEAVKAYKAFVLAYAESPLAVAAWGRLVQLSADQVEVEDQVVKKKLVEVREQWLLLQAALAAPADDEVAAIDLSEPEDDVEEDDDATASLRDTGGDR